MDTKNIHEAINAVMQEVGYVKKTKSGGLAYSFAGEAALIAACRPAMVENGIYMHVLTVKDVRRENYTTTKGTQMVNSVITAIIRFSHTSGTFIDVEAVGEGSDAGDKSANKAMTGLYKYAMRQTFCIETGDDPDKYASEERQAEPPPASAHDKIVRRWEALWKEGQDLNVFVEPLAPNMTDDEIVVRGKELSDLIKSAKESAK